jgi:hypothetical protein
MLSSVYQGFRKAGYLFAPESLQLS